MGHRSWSWRLTRNAQDNRYIQVELLVKLFCLPNLSLASIEILIDESIKRTFSVISFINNYYMVQKVADKEVSLAQ